MMRSSKKLANKMLRVDFEKLKVQIQEHKKESLLGICVRMWLQNHVRL